MPKFSKSFTVGHQDTDQDAALWIGRPGFVPGHDGLWSVAYMVGEVQWAVGVAFHRKADADLCQDWLIKHGYTPKKYHNERDEVVEAIKREVIANLSW